MNIAIRVDASSQIGTGHFMRCLTLADVLRRQGATLRFVSRRLPVHLRDMLLAKGHEFAALDGAADGADVADAGAYSVWLGVSQARDAAETLAALSGRRWDWLVVDHYALDTAWETPLRQCAVRILVIDDLANRRHDCDVLLDQNFYADMQNRYAGNVPELCTLLLGPLYALLREDFGVLHAQRRSRSGPVRRALVFFGGVDADNYTALALRALAGAGRADLQVDVVIGAQHPVRAAIEAACARHGYVCHVQTPHMATLMADADLAIGAGGTATWERCCLGLPTLTLCVAENQRQLVDDAAAGGLIYSPVIEGDLAQGLQRHLLALLENPGLRALLSRQGRAAVDGRGALRVARALGCSALGLRRAGAGDSADLLQWRNHPSIRAVSRDSAPITQEQHAGWLAAVLQASRRDLLIGTGEDGQSVGVVRFDVEDDTAEVSIYLVPDLGRRGLGADLLASAEVWLSKNRPGVSCIRAEVLGENWPSHRLFQAAGYGKHSTRYFKKAKQA